MIFGREAGSIHHKKKAVSLLLEETYRTVGANGGVGFAFQGGEPTVAGLEYFRRFVQQAKALRPQPGKGIQRKIASQQFICVC